MKNNMQCRYCGGSVALTDRVCPHCKKNNPTAETYHADMKSYSDKVASVKADIDSKKTYTVKLMVRGICIVCLIAAFIAGMISVVVFDRHKDIRSEAVRNSAKVMARLDAYWADEDYYGFFDYADSLGISGWADGPFLEYHPQIEASQIYIFINEYISQYLYADNIYDKNKALTSMCGLLNEFYDSNNLYYIYGKVAKGADSDIKVQQIHDNMDAVLKTYFYIDDTEAERIKEESSEGIELIIEESTERYKSSGK